uniref:Uncharacterized protein n=1 Tax=Rhizophora mucronata TaxID=61149 RepID=A0A2P2PIA0_RHIMU
MKTRILDILFCSGCLELLHRTWTTLIKLWLLDV